MVQTWRFDSIRGRVDKCPTLQQLTRCMYPWLGLLFFTKSLQHTDRAQQAFLAAACPSLYWALPTIETMYAQWDKASSKPWYHFFIPALQAGMEKLDEYYQRTATSDAHIIAMGKWSQISLSPIPATYYWQHSIQHLNLSTSRSIGVRNFLMRWKKLYRLLYVQFPVLCCSDT